MSDSAMHALREAREVIVCSKGSAHEVVGHFVANPSGIIILALDMATAFAATRAGLVAVTPPDLLDHHQLEAINAESRLIGEGLIARVSGEGPAVEIARSPTAAPVLDRALVTAFLERLLAVHVALESLDSAGVLWRNRVATVRKTPSAHERATPQTLLEELVPDYLKVVSRATGRLHWEPQRLSRGARDVLHYLGMSGARRFIDRLRARRSVRRDFADYFVLSEIPRGAVLLLGRTIEFRRNRDLVDEFSAGCTELVVGSLDHSYRGVVPKIAALAAEMEIPPILTPRPKWLLKSLYSARFRWRLLRWAADYSRLQVASGERGSVLLSRAVGAFLAERWAVMAWDWHAWKSAVDKSRPGIIIGFRTAPSVHIPLHAGLAAGVPAFTLPHGVVEEDSFGADSDELLAHLTPFARMGGASSSNWLGAPWTVVAREYPEAVGTNQAQYGDAPSRILLLVDGGSSLDRGALRARRQWEALEKFVVSQADTVFVAKDHPGQPVYACLSSTPEGVPGRLEFADQFADLHHLLGSCAGVILFDYFGSAAVHAVRAGLPTVRFEFDGRTEVRLRSVTRAWREAFLALPVARDLLELRVFVEGMCSTGGALALTQRTGIATSGPALLEVVERMRRQARSGR